MYTSASMFFSKWFYCFRKPHDQNVCNKAIDAFDAFEAFKTPCASETSLFHPLTSLFVRNQAQPCSSKSLSFFRPSKSSSDLFPLTTAVFAQTSAKSVRDRVKATYRKSHSCVSENNKSFLKQATIASI
jgi:hypothetical protein